LTSPAVNSSLQVIWSKTHWSTGTPGPTTNNLFGYNSGWQSGTVTSAKAGFYVSPISGSAPLTVWIWDTSVGAVSGQMDFGDFSGTMLRSTYHVYNGFDLYSLKQTVQGPSGVISSKTINIITDTQPPIG